LERVFQKFLSGWRHVLLPIALCRAP
jgi:hypothetical protein